MKFSREMIVFIIAVWLGLVFSSVMQWAGKVCIDYYGFAVDDVGNIYLGMNSTMKVFDSDGDLLRSISPPTSRGYQFSILNNRIVLYTGTFFYTMDLEGNVIEKVEITDENRLHLPEIRENKCITSNGTVYLLKSRFFRSRIYRVEDNKKIMVYEMPLLDYAVKLIQVACCLGMVIGIPCFILKSRGTSLKEVILRLLNRR